MTTTHRIGFITRGTQRATGSGANYYMAEQLRPIGAEMIELLIPPPPPSFAWRLARKLYRALGSYRGSTTWMLSRDYARAAARSLSPRLAASHLDLLFCALAGREMPAVRSAVPLVYCTDYTVPRVVELSAYPLFEGLPRQSVQVQMSLEADLVHRATLNLVPTEWIAQSLRQHYDVPAERIRVVPWGANIDSGDVPRIEEVCRDSPGSVCSLLFLGVEWPRKGGDLAYETLQHLIRRGVPAELIVAGCQPPDGCAHEKMRVLGRLDKNDPAARRRISDLLRTSSFLLLPTRGDTFGHVFCEAGAYALPSITTRVGGVGEVVRDGENGMALPLTAGADQYAETIAGLWFDHDTYRELSAGARRAFDERLNWDAWGREVRPMLSKILGRP